MGTLSGGNITIPFHTSLSPSTDIRVGTVYCTVRGTNLPYLRNNELSLEYICLYQVEVCSDVNDVCCRTPLRSIYTCNCTVYSIMQFTRHCQSTVLWMIRIRIQDLKLSLRIREPDRALTRIRIRIQAKRYSVPGKS